LLTGLNPGEHYQIYLKVEGFNDQIYGPFRAWIGKNDEAIEIDMQTIEEAMAAQGISTEAEPTPDSLCRDAYNAAVGFYQQKQWAEGISKLDESLVHLADIPAEEQGEDLNNIYKLYALFAFEMQDWQKTIEYGNKFLAIKPDQQSIVDRVRFAEKELAGPEPAEIYNEAIGFLNANDDAKAKQVLSGLAQSAPEYALTYFQLGKIETREFEFDNAVNYYKKFLKMSEGSTDPVVIKLREEAKDLIVTLLE
jgi:tetratricopeptide (TPR) repeat protein